MSSRTNEGIVPTLEEIQAYKERPPILATIELVNGALLTEDLPVAPDLNVKKVGWFMSWAMQCCSSSSSAMVQRIYLGNLFPIVDSTSCILQGVEKSCVPYRT